MFNRGLFALVALLTVAPFLIVGTAQAQTTVCQSRLITLLDFRNPVVVSGSALSAGAVYRFSNVAAGIDALVSIDSITNGSLNFFNRVTGLIANFQPELNNIGASSAEFTISFVIARISPPDAVSAKMNRGSDMLTLDLGAGLPQNSLLRLSAARDGGGAGNNARFEILFSVDDVSYTTAGIYGAPVATYPSAAQDILEHNDIAVPVAGARFIRFDTLNNDDIFIDGVEYSQVCLATTTLAAAKTVSIHDPASAGLFAVPGNDVRYTITVTNTGANSTDADSVFIVDHLPTEIEFYNGDIDDAGPLTGPVEFTQSGAGLTFSAATDLRFSNSATAPVNFAARAYTPPAGYDPSARFVCFNPKGAMSAGSPDPSFSVSFRARIQ